MGGSYEREKARAEAEGGDEVSGAAISTADRGVGSGGGSRGRGKSAPASSVSPQRGESAASPVGGGGGGRKRGRWYSSLQTGDADARDGTTTHTSAEDEGADLDFNYDDEDDCDGDTSGSGVIKDDTRPREESSASRCGEVHTYDYIGMTAALYDCPETSPDGLSSPRGMASGLVMGAYYVNIFLVLGNYILVMSHAVAAVVGEDNICLPTAGMVACVLMYSLSQIRTMANLGRSASAVSLLALAVVVTQCLLSIERGDDVVDMGGYNPPDDSGARPSVSLLRLLSALSSVGFAVGSQKLLLNIRHEMSDRDSAPRALGISLTGFGAGYAAVCVLSGPNPPPFLFDAVGAGPGRRVGGLLLLVHVAVSFAINCQALTSSLDRVAFHRVTVLGLNARHRSRWAVLTLLITASSYVIANAVPFFDDLVGLIGGLTSIPLTLLLPAVLRRRVLRLSPCKIDSAERSDVWSFLLVAFGAAFAACGLIGALGSIEMDWSNHGAPFDCGR